MAEFLNPHQRPRPSDQVTEDGMGNMGKPIPAFRKEAAYSTCKEFGLDSDKSHRVVSGMSMALERDKPYEAMAAGMQFIDLTGTYRIMAVLLVAPKPRIRVEAGAYRG